VSGVAERKGPSIYLHLLDRAVTRLSRELNEQLVNRNETMLRGMSDRIDEHLKESYKRGFMEGYAVGVVQEWTLSSDEKLELSESLAGWLREAETDEPGR
jgi:hypothetical protein